MLVCPKCFNESAALSTRFAERGKAGTCESCKAESGTVLDASELSDLFEGLQTLYKPVFDQYRYGKDGNQGYEADAEGDSLSEVLTEDWNVFSDVLEDDQKEAILKSVWPNYFGAYLSKGTDAGREVGSHWDSLKAELKHEWRFFRGCEEGGEFIERWLEPFTSKLCSQSDIPRWWRARIQEPNAPPFSPMEMGAPPRERATSGRANPTGISHLYVASLEETAVAEVRAEPGDCVTVARVTIEKSQPTVLDLTKDVRIIDPFASADLETAIVTRELLQIFAFELSRPIRASDSALDYVVTQFLSEYFRQKGFDGIQYPSALATKGINAVFFNPESATIGECTKRVVVSKVLEVVDEQQAAIRQRQRRGLPY